MNILFYLLTDMTIYLLTNLLNHHSQSILVRHMWNNFFLVSGIIGDFTFFYLELPELFYKYVTFFKICIFHFEKK